MGEFPVGGMSGRDAEMRVIGVQTPKSRRWEDTAKEPSQETRKQLCQDVSRSILSSTEYGSLPSGS